MTEDQGTWGRSGAHRQVAAMDNPDSPEGEPAQNGRVAVDRLTIREREVLALVGLGKTSKEIAQELGLSFKTVVSHRGRILSKLGARNTADLTRAAIRMGIIRP
jgi:DNA-binding NarL/FixJ family response regulator